MSTRYSGEVGQERLLRDTRKEEEKAHTLVNVSDKKNDKKGSIARTFPDCSHKLVKGTRRLKETRPNRPVHCAL